MKEKELYHKVTEYKGYRESGRLYYRCFAIRVEENVPLIGYVGYVRFVSPGHYKIENRETPNASVPMDMLDEMILRAIRTLYPASSEHLSSEVHLKEQLHSLMRNTVVLNRPNMTIDLIGKWDDQEKTGSGLSFEIASSIQRNDDIGARLIAWMNEEQTRFVYSHVTTLRNWKDFLE